MEKTVLRLLNYLQKNNAIIAPTMPACAGRKNEELIFEVAENINDIKLSNKLPLHSFKRFLLPVREVLEESTPHLIPLCEKGKSNPPNPLCERGKSKGVIFFGLTAPDLKAITILNHIFEKDPWYQNRMRNTLIVGYASLPDEYNAPFAVKYEENLLEHLQFDIFIVEEARSTGKGESKTRLFPIYVRGKSRARIFSGSEDGQRILDKAGVLNYEHVQFAGILKEEGPNPCAVKLKDIIGKLSPESKIFKDLGKRCIECGRCSLICPLCYCFCLDEGNCKIRSLTSCFYSEFSEIAGGHKFLRTPAERIYNWYHHKFVRFYDEISEAGCVSCGRCAKVCPVGIDIRDVLSEITKVY